MCLMLCLHTQKTAAGILLPKGPPKANSDAHFGEVGGGVQHQAADGSSSTRQTAAGQECQQEWLQLVRALAAACVRANRPPAADGSVLWLACTA